jgi:hypothetical protein
LQLKSLLTASQNTPKKNILTIEHNNCREYFVINHILPEIGVIILFIRPKLLFMNNLIFRSIPFIAVFLFTIIVVANAASFPSSAPIANKQNIAVLPNVYEKGNVSVFGNAEHSNIEFRVKGAQNMIKEYWAARYTLENVKQQQNSWLVIPFIALISSLCLYFYQVRKLNLKSSY